jgi:hypothetical protein
MKASLLSRTGGRLADALARFLAEPISRPAATDDVLALSALLHPGDVLRPYASAFSRAAGAKQECFRISDLDVGQGHWG